MLAILHSSCFFSVYGSSTNSTETMVYGDYIYVQLDGNGWNANGAPRQITWGPTAPLLRVTGWRNWQCLNGEGCKYCLSTSSLGHELWQMLLQLLPSNEGRLMLHHKNAPLIHKTLQEQGAVGMKATLHVCSNWFVRRMVLYPRIPHLEGWACPSSDEVPIPAGICSIPEVLRLLHFVVNSTRVPESRRSELAKQSWDF